MLLKIIHTFSQKKNWGNPKMNFFSCSAELSKRREGRGMGMALEDLKLQTMSWKLMLSNSS